MAAEQLYADETTVNHGGRFPMARRSDTESNTLVLRNADALREMYKEEDLFIHEIADRTGCGKETVRYWMKRHGIEVDYRTGEDHPRWRGGVTVYGNPWPGNRKKAIRRDGEVCQDCGLPRRHHPRLYGRDIEVHHIKPLDPREPTEQQHDLENLVTLCQDCHTARHRDVS